MGGVNQDDRAAEHAGDQTTAAKSEPMQAADLAAAGRDAGPFEARAEADDRALEEAGYGYGV